MQKITIEFSDGTLEKITRITDFYNLKNEIKGKNEPNGTIEDFITGCVNDRLNEIEHYYELSGYNNLGKPYQLKNRFKEIFNDMGLKQKDISKLTGIRPSNLSGSFLNNYQLSLDYFLRLWVLAECPPIYEVLYRENKN